MKNKVVGIFICLLLLITYIPIIGAINVHQSTKPIITNGTNSFYWVGVEYTFFITSVDPEGDNIYYIVDWGDGNNSGWCGPFESGETIYCTHYWTETGNYLIKCKTKDIYGEESELFELSITVIPPNRFFKNIEMNGTLKTKPWRGIILSVLNFEIVTIPSAMLGNAQLDPFICHNYKFLALSLKVHSYNKATRNIVGSAPFSIVIGY